MDNSWTYTQTASGVTVTLEDGKTVFVSANDFCDEEIGDLCDFMIINDPTNEMLEQYLVEEGMLSLEEVAGEEVEIGGGITKKDGYFYFEDMLMDSKLGALVENLVKKSNGEEKKYISFLNNLADNPRHDIYAELHGFLLNGDYTITNDGCFLAYKKVRDDYFDFYTGTISYKIGETVRMRPSQVNDDRTVTCSTGLHFASRGYLPQYAGRTGKVVIVKVNPAHVAAIPTDYNNSKGRCWELIVVGELDEEATAKIYAATDALFEELFNYDDATVEDSGDDTTAAVEEEQKKGLKKLMSSMSPTRFKNAASNVFKRFKKDASSSEAKTIEELVKEKRRDKE
jgi:hypothetical protein